MSGRVLRLAISVCLLAAIAWWLEPGLVVDRLRELDTRWVGAAVLVSVGQVLLSAWRWRFTAARLGLSLSLSRAVREYYLAMFVNQVLPGAVAGDASRAYRHARDAEPGPAVRAVIVERISGQSVMAGVGIVAWLVYPGALGGVTGRLLALAVVVALAGVGLWWWARRAPAGQVARLGRDTRVALWSRGAVGPQVVSSLLIVASYVVIYVLSARAVGVATAVPTIVPLIPLVLLSMLAPFTVAGWGVREGAAAVIWEGAGLDAADGVAASVAYGVVVLVTTLPGAWVAWTALGSRPVSGRRSGAVPAQVEVEEHVVAEAEVSAGRPEGLVERVDR